jgi:hypothetical protein
MLLMPFPRQEQGTDKEVDKQEKKATLQAV